MIVDLISVQKKKKNKDAVKDYIIDINNSLYNLSKYINLEIDELVFIDKIKPLEQKLREEAIKAAGITHNDCNNKIDRMKALAGIETEGNSTTSMGKNNYTEGNFTTSLGQAPPKTDWSRIDVDRHEKEKILSSIKANPKSNIFSKEFKWEPSEFLSAFKYLESPDKYNGPFIVSIVSDKSELDNYSKIKELSDGVEKIIVGKYIILSIYDISAQKPSDKYIYIGLNYLAMEGKLEFDIVGSIEGDINNSHRKNVRHYLNSMNIIINENDKYLNI